MGLLFNRGDSCGGGHLFEDEGWETDEYRIILRTMWDDEEESQVNCYILQNKRTQWCKFDDCFEKKPSWVSVSFIPAGNIEEAGYSSYEEMLEEEVR